MTRLATVALLLMPVSHLPAQRLVADRTVATRIDHLVKPEAVAKRFSGIVLVARGDRIIAQRAYGLADWERLVPNTVTTRFGLASLTKLMTEALMDGLVETSRVDRNAPVSLYISGFPDGPKGGHATIQDLLSHRAGVPHRVTTDLEESGSFNAADIVERVKMRGLLFEPGSAELYSSAGYTCLARVAELVVKKPFDMILQERVFQPASMASAIGETGQQLMAHRALPYVLQRGTTTVAIASAPYKDYSFLTGSGNLFSTAADLFHFVRALEHGTLGPAAQKLLGARGDTSWTNWYGRSTGYEGSVDYLPSADVTVVLLSNLRSGANWQIRERVRRLLLDRPVTAIAIPPAVGASFENPAQFVGSYGDPADPVAVVESNGRLFRDESEFYPVAGGRYFVPVSGAIMWFARDSSGRVESMRTRFGTAAERSVAKIARP